jgi:hypothetical protein
MVVILAARAKHCGMAGPVSTQSRSLAANRSWESGLTWIRLKIAPPRERLGSSAPISFGLAPHRCLKMRFKGNYEVSFRGEADEYRRRALAASVVNARSPSETIQRE